MAAADRHVADVGVGEQAPAEVAAQLPHARHGEQEAAVHAQEPGVGPVPFQPGDRDAQQVRALGGVEADVVALRLDEADVVAAHEAGASAQLDGHCGERVDRRAARGAVGRGEAADPVERGGEPFGGDGFEQVVDGADLVGGRGVLVEGGDEHDRGRLGHAREERRQLHAVHPGHRDVEEDGVEAARLEQPHGGERVGGGLDLLDAGRCGQQAAQLVEGRADVVDGEHLHDARSAARPHCATTPAWKRGSRSTTRVPASGAVSTMSP